MTTILAVVLGLPLLLANPFLLSEGKAIFYIFLYVIGFFGHTDDLGKEGFKKMNSQTFFKGVAFGLIGWVGIQITFLFNLSLLETQTSAGLDTAEMIFFNLTFVVVGEELVFRDSLPFMLFNLLAKKLDETDSFVVSFILSAVLFGVMHVVAYQSDLIAVVKAIIAGIILGFIRIYGGLFASYMSHALYNTFVIAGLFLLPF